jgi:hypothetical protein
MVELENAQRGHCRACESTACVAGSRSLWAK